MRVLLGLIDRILFAAALLVGLQLPALVQQYTQRLQDEHARVVQTLKRDDDYRQRNAAPQSDLLFAVLEAGTRAELEQQRDAQREALAVLQRASLPEKLWHLAMAGDRKALAAQLKVASPVLHTDRDALLCGLALAALASLLFQLLRSVGGLFVSRQRRLHYTPPVAPTAKPKPPPKRVEPKPAALTPVRREPQV